MTTLDEYAQLIAATATEKLLDKLKNEVSPTMVEVVCTMWEEFRHGWVGEGLLENQGFFAGLPQGSEALVKTLREKVNNLRAQPSKG